MDQARADRLKAALRENLKRRKAVRIPDRDSDEPVPDRDRTGERPERRGD